MSAFRQIGAVTLINIKSIPQRLATSLVTVVGIAGVVAVLISVLAMASGILAASAHTGRPDRVIVLSEGAIFEAGSSLPRDAIAAIADAPGVKRNNNGKPIASAEVVVLTHLPKKSNGKAVNVTVRAVGEEFLALRPEIKLAEGRMFQPAVHEVIVGRAAQTQFTGLGIGDHLTLRNSDWTVVGSFDGNGGAHDSEILTDSETLLSAYHRNQFQSLTALLDQAASFDRFKEALMTNPLLKVRVERETDFFASQTKQFGRIYSYLAYGVGGIMALGAIFGALNTMYSAVSTRSLEIATLRAIGFGGGAVVVSVLVEALLLGFAGALIGAGLAALFFNGSTISTISGGGSQMVYSMTIGLRLVVIGIVWACAIGVIGGLFPALRAARIPVAAALRVT